MKRIASHAGSWYSNIPEKLNQELSSNLQLAEKYLTKPIPGARALIGPHAGYAYSGPTAAYAYACINPDPIKRVFLLGPSHHTYLEGCALSKFKSYETPLGDLSVDTQVSKELFDTGVFGWMPPSVDVNEHSLELHLPFIAKIFENKLDDITLVPVLVGSLQVEEEKAYGKIFAKYLNDPTSLFIISSDFCHWGKRFGYTYCPPTPESTPIHAAISELDHQAMALIESLNLDDFAAYLAKTKNTICGRHPIGILMGAVAHLNETLSPNIKFVKYAQSNPCKTLADSSVSYASAYLYF
ncbi:cell motility mediator [Phycomyces blakesleeanus]|uniref:MEMO1 family protein n=2 Tax=Phycomyces blakesleeanus TaxID=4837 RepID=A0A167JNY1_PHYB8|nr:hypothetical protein PHYBLDRAFT_137295 [Phycomyces blakesleeanus NRRL 1555(-)]OAD66399.1 hypothetical protein PHYBLDRAFT_137295 [Phycomyces blakesleeanus NRRL 1555(-)]|eukprot:XP_018284439.1 hypothetical protein PHYBLDRAFT_137295 [Phycomyces blakesleeanus NRRL 1555(-)]